jgi:uncharacterized protein
VTTFRPRRCAAISRRATSPFSARSPPSTTASHPTTRASSPTGHSPRELDIPVAFHLGEGYPGAPYLGDPDYRVRFGSPLLLEEVLVRHPHLRLSVMHYGSPFVDEMIALMFTYPNVYIDIGGSTWPYPREYFYSQLKQLVDAGFGKRILFGSDQMLWPELIEISIEIVEEAPFLSEEQKRDIFYHNAARFLRLGEDEIARHHGRPIERKDRSHDER